jgi:Bifunctional DNA primase/polymerase, N-terminal
VEQYDDDFEELPQGERLWQVHDRVAAQRKRLLAAGYLPLPINGKVPPITGWQDIVATPAIIDRWTNLWPESMSTGLLTRTTPAIDIDIMHPEAAAAVEDLARERFEERGYFLVRIGRPPKRAILFRTDEPFRKIVRSFSYSNCDPKHPPKIEILAKGQQLVAAGIHPDTGKPYAWHGGEPGEIRREDLPYVREDEMGLSWTPLPAYWSKNSASLTARSRKTATARMMTKSSTMRSARAGPVSSPTSSPGASCTIQSATSPPRSSPAA